MFFLIKYDGPVCTDRRLETFMTLFEELSWRGLVGAITHDDLPRKLDTNRLTLYGGF